MADSALFVWESEALDGSLKWRGLCFVGIGGDGGMGDSGRLLFGETMVDDNNDEMAAAQ